MDRIYIVLTRTNTLVSNLIHIFTKDRYTHAAISLDKDLKEMYSFARKWTFNPFIGGFRKEDLDNGVYRFSRTLPGKVIEIEVSHEDYQMVKKTIREFSENRDKYGYNYLGLIYNFLNISVDVEDRFLCSEFVYHVLNKHEIIDLKKPKALVRPQNFEEVIGKVVYDGDLKYMEI